ncbi:RNA exonuclease 1 homolog isoform X2 [Hydra vulgaris]|uniref:RNA exonuclease 1 homolog isoform X2 n=1 Tax=Hydra vulgaris TaxID=6087 RepID=UPI000640CD49
MDFAPILLLYLQYEWIVLYLLTISMFVVGFIVFIILLWLPAPYGRYSQTGKLLSLAISPRLGWFLQESPAFFVPVFFIGSSYLDIIEYNFSITQLIVLGCFVLHYFIRTFYYSYNIVGGKPTPLYTMLLAFLFCCVNGYIQSRGIMLSKNDHEDNFIRILCGLFMFSAGLIINLQSDSILRNLRKPGETGYKIPKGGLFNFVSCANYTGEILEWIGFAIAAWNWYSFAFAYFTIANLVPRALHHHRFYLNKFDDYPKHRRAVLPFVGFAEEATAYQRSNRKQTYLNLCANIVKKIRSLPAYVPPDTEENLNTSKTETNRLMTSSITGYQKLNQKIYTALPKKIIKPVSPALVIAGSTAKVTDISQRRLSSEPIELNEDTFYTYLQDYLLSDGQLWENKYPLIDPNNDKMAIIKDYSPLPRNSLKRQCCRCGKDYFMNAKGKYITKEECNFHWGKLRRVKEKGLFSTQYSCCQSSESGKPCSFSRLHVCDKMTPLNEFVSTRNCINVDAKQKVLALDCEMCYTTQGLELTRLTIVDFQLQPMIDLYVKPTNPIVDYNTRFSGVTKEHLQNITTTLEDIQDILLDILHKDTILLGHSLESDLFALKMIHKKVVDTSIVFPHRLGHPFKRALRNLMADHLQKIIQNGEAGHDSSEDARACMELMKYKFKEDMKKKNRSAISLPSFYSSKSI